MAIICIFSFIQCKQANKNVDWAGLNWCANKSFGLDQSTSAIGKGGQDDISAQTLFLAINMKQLRVWFSDALKRQARSARGCLTVNEQPSSADAFLVGSVRYIEHQREMMCNGLL
jgi:hypothetical protein